MLPPPRCFTCNKMLSGLWYELQEMPNDSRHAHLMARTRRYCCRAQIMTTDDLTEVVSNPNFVTASEQHVMDFTTVVTDARVVSCR